MRLIRSLQKKQLVCRPPGVPTHQHPSGPALQPLWRFLEVEKSTGIAQGVPSEQQEEETDREKVLACRRCLAHITEENQRISVDGAHQHTFANPNGHVFDIGCFRSARGCLEAGPPSEEFTWFPGYSWRVVICAGCMTHLGWLFHLSGEYHFFGLILDCLVSSG